MRGKRSLFALVVGSVLLLGGIQEVMAEFQFDIGINVPYVLGVKTEDDNVGDTLDYVFLVPDIKFNYLHPVGPVKLGGGVRLWTFIIQSLAYPILTAEAELGRFVLNANAGGGLFMFFGLYNSLQTGAVFIPEVSAAYRLTPGFSVGTGLLLVFAPEAADISSFGYMGTVFGRFTIRPSN